MSLVNPVTCPFHLFDAFEVQFFKASYLQLIKDTDGNAMQLKFLKVETLLNIAFKDHWL